MRLDRYSAGAFDRGASRFREACWLIVSGVLFSTWLPGSRWRVLLLRAFGAQIGQSVTIKPGVRCKFPWRLAVGNHCWIGEAVWIDNLAEVTIGSHVCLSQGAYICTGSHDWTRSDFRLLVAPVIIGDHAWIAARASLAPGARVGTGAILGLASFAKGKLAAWSIYSGCPAKRVRERTRVDDSPADAAVSRSERRTDGFTESTTAEK